MGKPVDHESLTEMFLSVIQKHHAHERQIAEFANAPMDSMKEGIKTRIAFAGSIADDFNRQLKLSGVEALHFTTYTQADVIDLAQKVDRPHGATLHDLFDLDAPYEMLSRTYHTIMREVAENAAHRALVMLKGEDIAANSNKPPKLKH